MTDPRPLIFLSAAQKNLMAEGAGVYCYHYLGSAPKRCNDPFLFVSAQSFRAQLTALKNSEYTVTNLSNIAGSPPEKKVVLTIDDGARNFFEQGTKILGEFGFRAIQFIVSGQIGGINEWDAKHGHPQIPLMDDGQIREWLAEGHEIGSHSVNHRNLSKLNEKEARHQIIDSKKELEDRFGVPILHFSYPHGKFTPLTQDLVLEAGYETASTTRFGVHSAAQNLTSLPRIQPLSTGELAGKVIHRVRQKLRLCP